MMNENESMNDQKLNEYCKIVARDILDGLTPDQRKGEDVRGGALLQELAHEQAEGSQHVVYTWRAHDLCANCNIDSVLDVDAGDVIYTAQREVLGQIERKPIQFLYDRFAERIAYHEILNRIMDAIAEILKEDG